VRISILKAHTLNLRAEVSRMRLFLGYTGRLHRKGAYRMCFRRIRMMNKKTALFRMKILLQLEGQSTVRRNE
jgi:hypothetical protein